MTIENISKKDTKKKKSVTKSKGDSDICYFSVPLPFDTKTIDYIASINQDYKKCQIDMLFNNIPVPLSRKFNEWVMVERGGNENIKTYDDFAKYAEYAQSKGFEICFLMNSPKPFSQKDFMSFESDFYALIDMLQKAKVNLIKFSNVQVAEKLMNYAPEMRLSSSTATEYSSISQYRYLLNEYPNIEQINVAIAQNHNFALLKSLRHEFPDVELEIMINEPCLKGCPARISHISSLSYCSFNCNANMETECDIHFCKSTFVYPWWLKEYQKIGINHFKFFPALDGSLRGDFKTLYPLLNYMDCIEHGIEGIPANRFFSQIFSYSDNIMLPEHILLSDLISVLPDIKYFVKNGYKCSYDCGVGCKYCYNCAENLRDFVIKNGGEFLKQNNQCRDR